MYFVQDGCTEAGHHLPWTPCHVLRPDSLQKGKSVSQCLTRTYKKTKQFILL